MPCSFDWPSGIPMTRNYLRFLVEGITVTDAEIDISTRTDAALRLMTGRGEPTPETKKAEGAMGWIGENGVWGNIDVAYGGPANQKRPHVAFMGGGTVNDPRRHLAVVKYNGDNYPAAGNTETFTYGSNLTRVPGASIAFDASTGWFIIVWRDNTLQIQITFFINGIFIPGPALQDANGSPLRANETPSIVCGEATGRNCILVWGDIAENLPYSGLNWAHFKVSSWGFFPFLSLGQHMKMSFIMAGYPQVTYTGGTTRPFVVGWGPDHDKYTWTMTKTSSETSIWNVSTIQPHGNGTVSLAPVLGSIYGFIQIFYNYFD